MPSMLSILCQSLAEHAEHDKHADGTQLNFSACCHRVEPDFAGSTSRQALKLETQLRPSF
jgi:hypothetical protein